MVDMREEGVVAQWNDRGFGFIHFTDGRRAYVHNSQCGGNHLIQGEMVTTVVMEDERNPGKYKATDVQQVPGGGPEGARHPQDPMEALLAAARKTPRPHGRGGPHDPHSEAAAAAIAAAAAAAGAVGGGRGVNLGYGDGLDDPDRMEGTVTQWNERGFGFVEFSDGRRGYVHNSQCGGEHLVQGEIVTAKCAEDSKNPGKYQAIQVSRGPIGEDGTVTDWNEDKGYGFLLLDDRSRVYVHRSQLGGPGGTGSLEIGQRLRVTVTSDIRNPGKLCVKEVKSAAAEAGGAHYPRQPAGSSPGYGHGGPVVGGGKGGCKGRPMPQQIGSMPDSPPEDAVVAEWREDSGFGFLHTDDGRRIYCHRSMFGGTGSLIVGNRIHITAKPDSRNPGKWCVKEILSDPFTDAPPSAQNYGGNARGNSYSESCNQAKQNGGYVAGFDDHQASLHNEGDAVDGTVDTWNDSSGFGFLMLDDGRRAYIHRSSVGQSRSAGLMSGQRLLVTTKMDPRNPGKWCVGDVISIDGVILGEDAPDAKRQRVMV